MCTSKDFPPSERDELMGLVTQLQGQVAQLTAANEELQRQLAESQRGGKRQAAPFSKGRRSSKPRRPGRKPGTGLFSYRKPPSPDEVTEPVVEVSVSVEVCPGCGGRLEDEGMGVAYVTDIPPIRRPQVTAYRVRICRCRSCGRQVRGRHPDVAPDQYGASAHRVGRRVMAAAHVLHYGVGVPVRKVPAVLRALTGVEVSQGAISQDALRRATGAVGEAYHKLRTSVGVSRLVHTDDTGWRVGGEPAFLMAFETDEATVYQVRARHRNEEGGSVGLWRGDGGRSGSVRGGKCLDRSARWSRPGRERTQLRQASEGSSQRSDGTVEGISPGRGVGLWCAGRAVEARGEISSPRPPDGGCGQLQAAERARLAAFSDPSIEPTNNRARALRPAVIARKVYCSRASRAPLGEA